jgi:pimeloyl-ACP methyl ester carboxylesterase
LTKLRPNRKQVHPNQPQREISHMPATQRGRFGLATALEGRWRTAERPDTPLLVCLHGGGFDSRYFDTPSRSLLGQASAAGFPIVALCRPGYPADNDSARSQPSFSQAATIIAEAISDVWDQFGAGRTGVVLIGHSMGAAIAVHMAARQVSWPLIGLAISGVADTLSPFTVQLMQQLPADIAMTLPSDVGRYVYYGPDWTLNETTLTDFAGLSVSMPSADGVELGKSWPDDLPKIAPHVEVPLHYVLAEFDTLWESSPQRVEAFARHFSGAPFVEAAWWRCVGHNIEHHRLGEAYCRAVLAFAERCAMETHRTPI